MSETNLPLIVEPDHLERVLGAEGLLVVDVSEENVHAQHHVPGAVHLAYQAIIDVKPPAMGLLPDDRQLGEVLSALGMTADTHVVAYDDQGNGKAARLLWTLDVIGHAGFSLLNGGLQAWVSEGHPTEHESNQPSDGKYNATRLPHAIADKSYILSSLDDPDIVILDVRTPAEFSGLDLRAARGGHIPGAINMDWTLTMDQARNLRLKPEDELREMLLELGITPDKEVIAHCQTHHRSAHTYIVLKSLGYSRIKGYDGSWSEWGNDPEVPIDS